MTKEEQVALLRSGVDAWNQWRSNGGGAADLSDSEFVGLNLRGIDLEGANLDGARFRGCMLREAVLTGARMQGCDLRGSDLQQANLLKVINLPRSRLVRARNYALALYSRELRDDLNLPRDHNERIAARDFRGYILAEMDLGGAEFADANLSEAILTDSDLRRANLRGANLSGAELRSCQLEAANLSGADLRKANLYFSNLAHADFTGAILCGCNLSYANFSSTNLDGANLCEAQFQWRRETADLREARNLILARFDPEVCEALGIVGTHNANVPQRSFRGYDLRELDFSSADLTDADLSSATCAGATFRGAVLRGVNFEAADLSKVDLAGADASDAKLAGAICEGTDFADAVLQGADIQGAHLEAANNLRVEQVRQANNHPLAYYSRALATELGLPDHHAAHVQKRDFSGYDFSGLPMANANLANADLTGCSFRNTNLEEASFEGANLEGADLREALLLRANLSRAFLKNCKLRDADLRDADLREAQMLSSEQLSATNVSGADLPSSLAGFEALQSIRESSENARKLFASVLALTLYSGLTIASTKDTQLLTNTGTLQLPIIQTQIPIGWFYWVMPVLLLGVFFYFHFYLQNLWEELAHLPAFFPDGRPLHQRVYQWLLNSMARSHFAPLRPGRTAMSHLQYATSVLLTWWAVPLGQLVLWARYLHRHDWIGTSLHVAMSALAIGSATLLMQLAVRALEGESRRFKVSSLWVWRSVLTTTATVVLLWVLSWGAIEGPPVRPVLDEGPVRHYAWFDVRTWVPRLFHAFGITHVAQFDSEDVSGKPANWSGGSKADLEPVRGARLAGTDLRYAQARGAFLARADLRKTRLEGALLMNADLRQADLTGADLTLANLDGADLTGAVGLTEAQLRVAHTSRTTKLPADPAAPR